MTRLLFDENISPRLPHRVAASFPDSRLVRDLGLRGQSDSEIWARAALDGLTLVSKDDDFRRLSFLRGAPPKVIWLVVGNAGTESIANLLEIHRQTIEAFLSDLEESMRILRMPAER